ncbi:MAG TPA: glycosyl hydrolase [Opitutaceae bacterium]|nr:glycosyl hydrolase [Opitutaceae bacterium]
MNASNNHRLVVLGMTLLAFGPALAANAAPNQPWQVITDPTSVEAARLFAAPPPEYSAQFTWGWHGPVDRAVIDRDLDAMKALGVQAAIIEPATGMTHPYLSPEYFDLVRTAVEAAKARDMRLWIMDDGDYPSGLAGGKFTADRPDLRMKALSRPEHTTVAGGASFILETNPMFICAVATRATDGARQMLEPTGGRIAWTAPAGGPWDVAIVKWEYRTMPTRSANNRVNVKDTSNSLMDYLSPEATRQFKAWEFDAYEQVIGPELGKTVLGFRGDEPAYGFNPWTPRLLEEFRDRKGYDLRPYLPAFAAAPGARIAGLSPEERRVYADYCDVWSDLYRDNYFNLEADWCAAHGVEMQLHIEHEDILPQLAISDGDYFKAFRNIQVPGIDIIWHQLWMDNPADFPKLASSAAHLYGKPRAMCEAFAAYRPPPNLKQARWLLDFLLSHGINRIEYMFWPASVPRGTVPPRRESASAGGAKGQSGAAPAPRPPGAFRTFYYRDPGFPAVAAYVNRLSYLLGEGRPAAQIGLYMPSSSFWVTDAKRGEEINRSLLAVAHELIATQRDFDFVDEQALSSVLKPEGDGLVNLSGQAYRAIIVPPCAAISRAALDTLRRFARAGGRVIFLGNAPDLAVGKTFRDTQGPADFSWATLHEPSAAVTPRVVAALPSPDFSLAAPAPLVSYNHRRLRDADVYFVFNSGDAPLATDVTLAGSGKLEIWDANTGKVSSQPDAKRDAADRVSVPLNLPPWGTTLLVLNHGAHP